MEKVIGEKKNRYTRRKVNPCQMLLKKIKAKKFNNNKKSISLEDTIKIMKDSRRGNLEATRKEKMILKKRKKKQEQLWKNS